MKLKRIHFFVALNYIKFKKLGIQFGKHLRVFNKIYVKKDEGAEIKIGDYLTFTSGGGHNPINGNMRGYIRIEKKAKLFIGNNCGLSSTVLWVKEKMNIGNNVLIGGGCIIMDNDCHSIDYKLRNSNVRNDETQRIDSENTKSSPVIIEDNVLVGARCIILKGVTIGARSVIGAGSVVTQSIPCDSIAAGNPCKVIKKIEQ